MYVCVYVCMYACNGVRLKYTRFTLVNVPTATCNEDDKLGGPFTKTVNLLPEKVHKMTGDLCTSS